VALIVRIISADGKKVISRVLPALPSHLKVPAGARVEVIDKSTGVRETLGHYINERSRHKDKDKDSDESGARDRVTVETVQDWQEAEAWLAHMDQNLSSDITTSDWFAAGTEPKGDSVLGFDKTTLLIGGAVGAAIGVGVAVASDKDQPKDTIAPAAPTGLDLAEDDDTGSSNTDNITNKTSGLTITGTAEAGSTVELFDGNTSLGTVTASATGTFTMDITLAEGTHAIRAIATDIAGNKSAGSTALNITVDTTAPATVTALDLAAADDTGVSSEDNITNKTSGLTITGTTDAGAVVELFNGTASLGKATAGTDGKFTLDIALPEGTHNITATATDIAGNVSEASSALPIIVDTTAPSAPTQLTLAPEDDTGPSNSDGITDVRTGLTITGMTDAGITVDLYNGASKVATTVADASGLFSFEANLSLGTHTLVARTVDVAGNLSANSPSLVIQVVEDANAVSANTALAALMLDTYALDDTFGGIPGTIA